MPITIEDLPADDELSDEDLDSVAGGASYSLGTTPSISWGLQVNAPQFGSSLKNGWSSVPMVATENATAGVRG